MKTVNIPSRSSRWDAAFSLLQPFLPVGDISNACMLSSFYNHISCVWIIYETLKKSIGFFIPLRDWLSFFFVEQKFALQKKTPKNKSGINLKNVQVTFWPTERGGRLINCFPNSLRVVGGRPRVPASDVARRAATPHLSVVPAVPRWGHGCRRHCAHAPDEQSFHQRADDVRIWGGSDPIKAA